jgi:dTDP-4-amino-4,6-dideoxygalactose transaminase
VPPSIAQNKYIFLKVREISVKFLLDKSALERCLENEACISSFLNLKNLSLQDAEHQFWVYAEDIATLLKSLEGDSRASKLTIIHQIISKTAMIPLRAFMLEKALNEDGPFDEHALVRQAAATVTIDAVITEAPEIWEGSGHATVRLNKLEAAEKNLVGPKTSVPFLDLKAQLHQFYNEVDERFHEIIHSTGFILGPYVQAFERDFAAIQEIPHCIGVSTGTDALHIALLALGIGFGDRVLVPVNTFIATAEAVSMVGATPIFVDCDEFWNLSVDHCAAVLSDLQRRGEVLPKAIVPVHLYGQPADMAGIVELAAQYDLRIIEDCCQAHLARWQGQCVGSFGDFGAFSFYPGKNLGAYGEAGALVAKDNESFEKALLLRQHGETKKYHHQVVGHNFRMAALQGAVLGAKLPYLPGWSQRRCENARLYNSLLEDVEGVRIPKQRKGAESVYHLYVIQAAERDELAAFLNSNGVATGLHYPVPLHLQPAYSSLGYQKGDFPVAEKSAMQLLSLPMYPELSKIQIERVCRLIKAFNVR